jgi:hypothetical protein
MEGGEGGKGYLVLRQLRVRGYEYHGQHHKQRGHLRTPAVSTYGPCLRLLPRGAETELYRNLSAPQSHVKCFDYVCRVSIHQLHVATPQHGENRERPRWRLISRLCGLGGA